MIQLLHDEATLLHETVELLGAKIRPALESPDRIRAIVSSLEAAGREIYSLTVSEEQALSVMQLAIATHGEDYINHLRTTHSDWLAAGLVEQHESVLPECFRLHNKAQSLLSPPRDLFARAGYYAFDMSTGIMKDSWRSILASANLAIQTAAIVAENGTTLSPLRTVLALTRPPGHHCTGQQAGGYCYINNIALAVTRIRLINPSARFAILDLDFHHGNGTQEIFWSDSSVFYASIHGQDEFPYYTGHASEVGPHNTILNLPLPAHSSFAAYQTQLTTALHAIQAFAADYLLVSLGFDTFRLDPLGSFQIDMADYTTIARMVRESTRSLPAVILLEGGYVIEKLGENVLAFINGWESVSE